MCHHNGILALIYKLALGMGLAITSTKQLYPCLDIRISQRNINILYNENQHFKMSNVMNLRLCIQFKNIKINIKIAFTLCI